MKKTKMFSLIACLALFAVSFVNINDAFAAQEISISPGGGGLECNGWACRDVQGVPMSTIEDSEGNPSFCCEDPSSSAGHNKF